MRIAIDMDEVLCDTHSGKAALYAARGFTPSEEDLAGKKFDEIAPADAAREVEMEMQKGFFFANLDPIEGAVEAVAELSKDHEIFIATAAMEYPASCGHKIAWMQRHFPIVDPMNIVFCGDKGVVRADVLIDDSPRHFAGFEGTGVCFSALHNRGEDVPYRLDRWADAPALIAKIGESA